MTIDFQQAFKFNLDINRVVDVPIPPDQTDFGDYIKELINDVVGDTRSKKYLFPGVETTTMKDMKTILSGSASDAVTAAKSFATRLKGIENRVQDRIEHLNKEVQRGIIILAVVTMGPSRYFLIIKAEHFDFIDEGSRQKTTGLPIKKKIFKAFCGHLDENDAPLFAMVSDNRAVISSYWWQDFLELEEEYTDEYNTETSFDVLDRRIFQPMRKKSPSDFMHLRNATVAYFRSREEFVLEDYIADVVQPYSPEEPTVDIERVVQRIRSLPESGGFNTRFKIIREMIKKRISTRVKLTPQLELYIKENIDLGTDVEAVKENNVKYLKIRTNAGYDHFKKT